MSQLQSVPPHIAHTEEVMKKELSNEVYKHFSYHSRSKQRDLSSIPTLSPGKKQPKQTRRKKHPYAFYNQFRPILYVLQFFGRYALQVTDQGEYRVRWFSLRMLYCVMCYGAQTYLAVIVCFRRLQALEESKGDYDEFIFSIHVLAYLSAHFQVPFCYWIQGSNLANYLRLWADFQDEWESTFGKSLKMSYERTVVIVIVIVIPSVLIFLVFEQQTTLNDPLHYFIPYFISIVSSVLVVCFWFCTCLEIRRISQDLTIILTERLENHPTPWLLTRWRLLWLNLRSLTESLGTDLCFVTISIVGSHSATFLLGVYNGLVQLISNSFSLKTIGYLSAAAFSLSVVFMVCDGGEKAASGVVSSTLSSLLKRKLYLSNQEIRHEVFVVLATSEMEVAIEIYLLLEAIKADPAEIRLGGFVTLNRPLVVSLFSNTLTYLIVLLQFKINEK